MERGRDNPITYLPKPVVEERVILFFVVVIGEQGRKVVEEEKEGGGKWELGEEACYAMEWIECGEKEEVFFSFFDGKI